MFAVTQLCFSLICTDIIVPPGAQPWYYKPRHKLVPLGSSRPSLPCRVLEDEIQQLRSELRETVDENGRLYKLLKERDFEIKHLKKKIEEDRLAFTGNSAHGCRVQVGGPSCPVIPESSARFSVATVVFLSLVLGLDATPTFCVLQKGCWLLCEMFLRTQPPSAAAVLTLVLWGPATLLLCW